jgi:hypothetical protein
VTVLATTSTSLSAADVFYFGNAVGDTGNNPGNTLTDALDGALVLANIRPVGNPAAVDHDFDFNRDGMINALDYAITRDFATSLLNALPLLNLSAFGPLQPSLLLNDIDEDEDEPPPWDIAPAVVFPLNP